MYRVSFTAVAALLCTLPLAAQTRADRDAKAALALAVASAKPISIPVTPAIAREKSYADVIAYTLLRRQPVLVSVGLDCSNLCALIRKDIPTTHAKTFAGDSTPHLQLVVADADGVLWKSGQRWTTVPSEKEVRAAAHALDKAVNAPKPAKPKQAATPNVGICPCGQGQCLCLPASKCANGQCPTPQTMTRQTQESCPS